MFSKLTRREKVLIYIMASFIVVAVGLIFVIKPLASWNSSVDGKYQKLKAQKIEMEAVISQKTSSLEQMDKIQQNIQKTKKKFLKTMENEKTDELITGIVQESGLTPQSLEIGVSDTGTNAFSQSSQTVDSSGDTGSSSGTSSDNAAGSSEKTDTASADSGSVVTVDKVTVTAGGSFAQFIKLLSLADEEPGIRVSSFSVEGASVSDEVVGTTSGDFTVQIVFELYHADDSI